MTIQSGGRTQHLYRQTGPRDNYQRQRNQDQALPLFFLKKACLRAFKRVWLVRKIVSTISPLRKCGAVA